MSNCNNGNWSQESGCMENNGKTCCQPHCPSCCPGPQGSPGSQGEPGPQGIPGENGPIAATIPFSLTNVWSSGSPVATDDAGNPSTINFVGFGGNEGSYPIYLEPGEWQTGTITFRESTAYGSAFIMPYDGTVKNIYVLFATRTTLNLEAGIEMYPFVCLAVSNSEQLVFTVLQDTLTYTAPYVGGVEYPKYTVRRGALTGLDIRIPEGTLVAIVAGWRGQGVTEEQSTEISASGGIFVE